MYDYTGSLSQAYSDGVTDAMAEVENGVYALYGGDVTQDGTSDVLDMLLADNDAMEFAFGYNATDCNGDGSTDLLDMILIENNAGLFLFMARPY